MTYSTVYQGKAAIIAISCPGLTNGKWRHVKVNHIHA